MNDKLNGKLNEFLRVNENIMNVNYYTYINLHLSYN